MRADCYFCHIKTVQNLINKFQPSDIVAEDFIFSVHKTLEDNKHLDNPMLATKIHRIAKEKLKVDDLYSSEKFDANSTLMADYDYWRKLIDSSPHPFKTAVKLAVAGNIIDYGAHSVKGEIKEQLAGLINSPLTIDHTEELYTAISKANSILYLGDNAGEIFFDKLLLETIKHPNITFVTRGEPVINDITHEDAKQVGIHPLCKVISNGYDAPSTLLEFCSEEFLELYNNADLIISKGQGNFEGLMNSGHLNTFFLLIAKCKPIADILNCKTNNLIVSKITENNNAL